MISRGRVGGFLTLIVAVALGVLVVRLLMAPPSGELATLAVYLAGSGAVTLVASGLVFRMADGASGFTLRTKAILGSAAAGALGLLNVLVVAELMFISTGHDLKLLIAFVCFSGVITVVLSVSLAGYAATGVGRVLDRVRSLAGGDYETMLDSAGSDELAMLARDVNRLAERLGSVEAQRQALDEERRSLTVAVSHDLRTPLASLRALVEALDDCVISDDGDIKAAYGTLRREVERLSGLIDVLFDLARMDAGALPLDLRHVRLQEIAAEVVEALQVPARLQGVCLELQLEDLPGELLLDGALLERAVTNLLDNALEHTPAGGSVAVKVEADGAWASLQVSDTGEGIDAADLPHVWERFYRAEKSRQRNGQASHGAGLGLAIVRGIVEAHGGRVAVESEKGEGATFTILLPTAREGAAVRSEAR